MNRLSVRGKGEKIARRGKGKVSPSLQCKRILGGRKLLVYVRTDVTAIFVITEEIRESKNSNPKGRCRGERRKEGRGKAEQNTPFSVLSPRPLPSSF